MGLYDTMPNWKATFYWLIIDYPPFIALTMLLASPSLISFEPLMFKRNACPLYDFEKGKAN